MGSNAIAFNLLQKANIIPIHSVLQHFRSRRESRWYIQRNTKGPSSEGWPFFVQSALKHLVDEHLL